MGPTWQAVVPELEKREEAKSSVALKSLGISIARSIGPAAGGLLLPAFGAGVTCGADIATYPAVIAALIWWPRASSSNTMSKAQSRGFLRSIGFRTKDDAMVPMDRAWPRTAPIRNDSRMVHVRI